MNDLVQLAGKWLAPVGPHPYLRSVAVLLAFVVVATLATWNPWSGSWRDYGG